MRAIIAILRFYFYHILALVGRGSVVNHHNAIALLSEGLVVPEIERVHDRSYQALNESFDREGVARAVYQDTQRRESERRHNLRRVRNETGDILAKLSEVAA